MQDNINLYIMSFCVCENDNSGEAAQKMARLRMGDRLHFRSQNGKILEYLFILNSILPSFKFIRGENTIFYTNDFTPPTSKEIN